MITRAQLLNKYGNHLGLEIVNELKGVGTKKDFKGNITYYAIDIRKAYRRVSEKYKHIKYGDTIEE